jgi:hypothetical protein
VGLHFKECRATSVLATFGNISLVHIDGINQLADELTKMKYHIGYVGRVLFGRRCFLRGIRTPLRDGLQHSDPIPRLLQPYHTVIVFDSGQNNTDGENKLDASRDGGATAPPDQTAIVLYHSTANNLVTNDSFTAKYDLRDFTDDESDSEPMSFDC